MFVKRRYRRYSNNASINIKFGNLIKSILFRCRHQESGSYTRRAGFLDTNVSSFAIFRDSFGYSIVRCGQ